MKLFKKKDSKDAEVHTGHEMYSADGKRYCYVLIDSYKSNIAKYFRDCGINVKAVETDPDEILDTIMLEDVPYRVVIIETGSGNFNTTSVREKLVNILASASSSNYATVFFTERNLKSDVSFSKEVDKKYIDWHKYNSTMDCVATLIKSGETYNGISSDEIKRMEQQWLSDTMSNKVDEAHDIKYTGKEEFMKMSDIAEFMQSDEYEEV